MELIVEDADVITMAAGAEPARAMLVRDGRIAAVGVPDEVRAAAGASAQVVRLDGATVVPGLIDAHCHVADVGYLAAAADCSQPSAPDIPAIAARLRDAADQTPEGSWVTGGGYVEYKLREGRHPTRDELDQAVPNRPAVVYHTSLHACVLNTAALREAGFADQQPDPAGGAFGRDRDGRLDGVVFERPMFQLFERNLRQDLARMGSAERNRLVERASQQLASFGLTAACDADDPADWPGLAESHRREFLERTDRGVFSQQAEATLNGSRGFRVLAGRAVGIQAGQRQVVVEIEYGSERERVAYDLVVVAIGFQARWFEGLLGDQARGLLASALGGAELERRIGPDLSVAGLSPPLHLPAVAGLAQGPGFPNLSCLGLLSDRILGRYVTAAERREHV